MKKRTKGILILAALGAAAWALLRSGRGTSLSARVVDAAKKQIEYDVTAEGKNVKGTFTMGEPNIYSNITGTEYHLLVTGNALMDTIQVALGKLADNGGFVATDEKIILFS